jgi:signal transduction histidine kinase
VTDFDPLSVEPALVAGVMHELKQPLMGIRCGLEVLSRSLGPAITTHEEWPTLLALVSQLDDVVRGWQCLVDPAAEARTEFALEPVVQHAVTLLRHRLRPLGGRFAVVYEAPLPPVHGSRRAVLHGLLNVLCNALDAAEERGGERRVEVRARPAPGARLEIRVADDGAGIDAAVAPHLFERGATSKPRGKGTGLGLHIARAMLERSGGGLRVAAPGEAGRASWAATEFVLEVPALEVA